MSDQRLQLMIYGDNIAAYRPTTVESQWLIESIERTENPNYLFINLVINKDAKAGDYQLLFVKKTQSLKQDSSTISIKYTLKKRRSGSALRQGFSSADSIYLVTPDRFANGKTSNDQVNGMLEGVNRNNQDDRHGGDIQGIINHLEYIADMGFSQLWVTPMLENNNPQYSYHGYGITDHYQIDKRFGSNRSYKELSKTARQKGIGLIKDSVLNHVSTNHWWMKDLPSLDWFNHGKTFVATSHKRESLHDIHATEEDRKAFTDGWFVPTMADLNQRNPLVERYLIQNNIWWIEMADLSGIRIDTFSYSEKYFLQNYTQQIMQEYPNFNLVAEEWSISPIIVSYWQRGKQRHDQYNFELPSLMDFPLQNALIEALNQKESWADGLQKLYSNIATDFIYPDAGNLVVFPDNHDMSRIFTQLKNDIKLTKMAIAFIATTRGIPQFYYGTEILMENPSSDSHGEIRSDFPGGWQDDKVSAFTGIGLSEEQKDMQYFVKNLLNWRKNSEATKKGKLTHYAPKQGVYVYFRHSDKQKVMIVLNKNFESIDIDPLNYPSMLSESERQGKATNIITNKPVVLDRKFKVEGRSAYVLQIN